jgi:hypothetical protein
MKSLWILAAAATFAACAGRGEDDVGAAPDRGDDTTAVTTEVDTSTGQWDTTSTTGDINADTALTPTTPADTTVGEYPTPEETPDPGMETDTSMTSPDTGAYAPDTGAYAPETGADTTAIDTTGGYDPAADPSAGADTSGMGTDTMAVPADPSVPADSTYPTPQ